MAMSRKAEYRADAFSASLGYKSDMISALEVLDELSAGSDNSFMGKLMSTHPATMLRIGALEDDEVARKNIGGLFVATPFATNYAAGVAGNGEVIRLSTVLLIAGVLWCGMGFWDSYKYKQGVYEVVNPPATVLASHTPDKNGDVHVANQAKSARKHSKRTNASAHHVNRANGLKNVNSGTVDTQVVGAVAPKVDNMVHINNVYKVSDSSYTVNYTYHEATSTAIKHQAPNSSSMTYCAFNSL